MELSDEQKQHVRESWAKLMENMDGLEAGMSMFMKYSFRSVSYFLNIFKLPRYVTKIPIEALHCVILIIWSLQWVGLCRYLQSKIECLLYAILSILSMLWNLYPRPILLMIFGLGLNLIRSTFQKPTLNSAVYPLELANEYPVMANSFQFS